MTRVRFKATIEKELPQEAAVPESGAQDKTTSGKPVAMYAPLKQLLPEIPGLP
jgi:hypothetical protein